MPGDSSRDGSSLSEEEHSAAAEREVDVTTGYGTESGNGFGSGTTNGCFIGTGYGDGDGDTNGDSREHWDDQGNGFGEGGARNGDSFKAEP